MLREEISTDSLAYLQLAKDKLKSAENTPQGLVVAMMPLEDILYGFYGCFIDHVYSEEIRDIFLCAKSVERVELYIRLKYRNEKIHSEFERLCNFFERIPMNTPYRYNPKQLTLLSEIICSENGCNGREYGAISTLGKLFDKKLKERDETMKTLNFSFATKLTFDNYVHYHSFALRCMPIESATQHIAGCEMSIFPFVPTQNTVDAFGNTVTAGYISKEHRFLDFEINGRAEIDVSKPKTDFMPCYLYQSEYARPDKDLMDFYAEIFAECSKKIHLKEPFFSRIFYLIWFNTKRAYVRIFHTLCLHC